MFLENSHWIISLDLVLLDLHLIPNFFILLDFAFPIPYLSIPLAIGSLQLIKLISTCFKTRLKTHDTYFPQNVERDD